MITLYVFSNGHHIIVLNGKASHTHINTNSTLKNSAYSAHSIDVLFSLVPSLRSDMPFYEFLICEGFL